MITYFTEQDLVSFGNYLLSDNRREAYEKYGVPEDQLVEAMSVINPLDLTSWVDFLIATRKQAEQAEQINNQQNEENNS